MQESDFKMDNQTLFIYNFEKKSTMFATTSKAQQIYFIVKLITDKLKTSGYVK